MFVVLPPNSSVTPSLVSNTLVVVVVLVGIKCAYFVKNRCKIGKICMNFSRNNKLHAHQCTNYNQGVGYNQGIKPLLGERRILILLSEGKGRYNTIPTQPTLSAIKYGVQNTS